MFWTRATASSAAARLRTTVLVVGVLAFALVWLASGTRAWQAMDAKVFDLFTTWTAPRKVDIPLVILAIDEPSFQQMQVQWPFPRRLHAQVLERLRADGARAVGFDMVFAEPSNPADDAALERAIRGGPPVVLAASRELTESGNASLWSEVMPLDAFVAAGALPGQVQVTPDDDFVVRRQAKGDDSFSSRLARLAGGDAALGERVDLIEYVGPRATFDTRSYYQALDPALLPKGVFKDKIVLIGRSVRMAVELNRSQSDMFNSPFVVTDEDDRLFPGVEVQANLISNRLTGGGLRTAPDGAVMALVLIMLGVLAVVGLRSQPLVSVLVACGLGGGVWVLSLWLFVGQKVWLTPLFAMASVLAVYGASMLVNYRASRRRALQIRAMFSQYVPREVVARLVEHPEQMKLGGEARVLTLMFTDLANFTAMSERLTAEATVDVLTEYFNVMTSIIHRHGGTVDKFIGDAVMAFWGAPLDDDRHAEHAVRAAIEMQAAMEVLSTNLQARGLPAIAMRVGLHTGRVVVGNVGSHSRFSYTVIGDAVNLAARLEGANKAFGTGILLSEATAALLPPDVGVRHVNTVIVKGKSEAVKVYTPCSDPVLRAQSVPVGSGPLSLDKL
ncbi:MAG: adenylate/guanylate cyclase domain-containing protein [Burkholderiales bacterium]|nr:adenylate/guanylate cyclase domain-containing protein [Burkholderiales bacterium]